MRWLYGDLEGAIGLQRRAVAAGGPGLPEPTAYCLTDLSGLLRRAGRLEEAARAAEAALQLVPGYPAARVARADVHAMRGEVAVAVALVEEVVAEHPGTDRWLRLAEWHGRLGSAAERDAALARAEARSGEVGAVARYLARHGQRREEAVAWAEAAATARPTVTHLDTWALALLRADRPREAAAVHDRAVALGTADATLHLHRGLIAARAGGRRHGASEPAGRGPAQPARRWVDSVGARGVAGPPRLTPRARVAT